MFKEQTFNANGVLINYALSPAPGPPLILLHGITERWQTFLPLIPHLSKNWQLYIPDLRGHGQSDRVNTHYRVIEYAEDIIVLLDTQINQPSVILGHSLGALITICVAARRPQQVLAIILEEPPLHLQHTPLKNIPNGPYEAFTKIVKIVRSNQSWQAIEKELGK